MPPARDDPGALTIDEQGQLNLAMATVLTPEEAAQAPGSETDSATPPVPAATPEATPPVPIKIGTIQGQGGKLIFADRSFKPGYQTTIESVETRITGLSTEATEPAKVDIKGRVDGHAPVTISGAINPLADEMYADLAFDFQFRGGFSDQPGVRKTTLDQDAMGGATADRFERHGPGASK